MGHISNQIRQIDLAGWGIAALACGALAVLSANLAAFIPPSMLAGLHATHIQGGSFNQMRAQMAEIARETMEINRDYTALRTRLNLIDDSSGVAIRRLAAVENSLPLLIEALPLESDIDRSLLTASIAEAGGDVFAVDGGKVRIRQMDLFSSNDAETDGNDTALATEQPMPPALEARQQPAQGDRVAPEATDTPGNAQQGIAIGAPRAPDALGDAWDETMDAIGPLLLGLEPRAIPLADDAESRLVVGPLSDLSAAETLCSRIERAGLECAPAPFEGAPLLAD